MDKLEQELQRKRRENIQKKSLLATNADGASNFDDKIAASSQANSQLLGIQNNLFKLKEDKGEIPFIDVDNSKMNRTGHGFKQRGLDSPLSNQNVKRNPSVYDGSFQGSEEDPQAAIERMEEELVRFREDQQHQMEMLKLLNMHTNKGEKVISKNQNFLNYASKPISLQNQIEELVRN